MVLTQVAMLEKEKAIPVTVERRASEEVASLSKCVHRLQVDIFSHVEYVCQFQIFSCWNVSTCKTAEWHAICICVESLCRHGAFNCDIWMECYRLHLIPFRQWKKLMRYIDFSCDFFWAWVSGLGWQFETCLCYFWVCSDHLHSISHNFSKCDCSITDVPLQGARATERKKLEDEVNQLQVSQVLSMWHIGLC
jgi:hypothetical protein